MKPEDIKNTANDLGDRASQSASDAKQTASDMASRASATTKDYADQASNTAQDLYGRAKDQIHQATSGMPDKASDAMAAGQRAMDKGTAELSRQVAKQPIEALILAGAIGYLVGWATTRG